MSGWVMESGRSVLRAVASLRRCDGLVVQLALVAVGVVLLGETLTAAAATPPAVADPWSKAASGICMVFSDVVGPALAVVLVIVIGLTYAGGEGGSKSTIAYLVFGLGMVVMAPNFIQFFFGGTITC